MRIKNKKGSALVYALGIITIVATILVGILQLITSQAKYANDVLAREKAFQIAETCTHEYRWYLAHNTDGHTIEEVLEFWENTDPEPRGKSAPYIWDVKTPEGIVVGKCSAKIINPPVTTSQPVNVEFAGWLPEKESIKKKINVTFRRTSWSDYVVLSNDYASFDSKWDIKGKIMSNAGVHFDGVAHNKVYAGSTNYIDPVTNLSQSGVWSSQTFSAAENCEFNADKNSCVFLAGRRYPVPQKDFSGIAVDLNAMATAAKAPNNETIDGCTTSNCYFDVPIDKPGKHLTLNADGTFEIVTVKDIKSQSRDIKNEIESTRIVRQIPNNGIIFINGSIWIDGIVDHSRVTVVAGGGIGDIYIGSGNLKYTNKDGSDVIGLIAKGNILLTNEKQHCTGAECNDLTIHAAMVAKDGKVGKENFNPNCCGNGCEAQKNRIDVFGSVVSNKFIEFTTSKFCSGQGTARMGFETKNIEYDNNLFVNPPPFFPSDVYYSVDLWEEV